jgi:plasmid stability protein
MASVIDKLEITPMLKARLAARANEHGRTVDQEAADILSKELEQDSPPKIKKGLGSAIHALFVEAGEFSIPEVPRELARDPIEFQQ